MVEDVYIDSTGQKRRKMPVKIGRRADGAAIWGDGEKIWVECLPGGCREGREVWHTPGSWHRREPCTPVEEGEAGGEGSSSGGEGSSSGGEGSSSGGEGSSSGGEGSSSGGEGSCSGGERQEEGKAKETDPKETEGV